MTTKTAKQFDELAEEVRSRASGIDATPAAYRQGLRAIITTLEEDLAASLEMDGEDEEDG